MFTEGRRAKPDPTPEEIREACERIQAKWTAKEEAKRLVATRNEWTLPSYATSTLGEGFDDCEAVEE